METVDATINRLRKEVTEMKMEISAELNEYPWFTSLGKFEREQILYHCMRWEVKGEQIGFSKACK